MALFELLCDCCYVVVDVVVPEIEKYTRTHTHTHTYIHMYRASVCFCGKLNALFGNPTDARIQIRIRVRMRPNAFYRYIALSTLALVLALRVLVSLLVEPEIVILAAALDGLTPLHHPSSASS